MRTEGAMANATWNLLLAFVGVVAYMPEPVRDVHDVMCHDRPPSRTQDDGVAAPGELVNEACKLLANEFAVPLSGAPCDACVCCRDGDVA
jgi:hypothetical protein